MYKGLTFLGCLFVFLTVKFASGRNTAHLIALNQIYLSADDPQFADVKAGDTLYFAAGKRQYLLIKNFQGAPGKPIVMINSGGDVIIDTDNYYGIAIQNCRYIKLTGTGDPKQTYGIQITRVAGGGGLGLSDLSSDYEIDHISIKNTLFGGIYAKSDPDCTLSSVRGTFTQYNTVIHDNYLENTGNEGIYAGSSKYSGQIVTCNGKDELLLPSLLDGVKIYNNIIKYAGWDGIQVSSASKNCQIYNNTILFDSQMEVYAQMSGILIGSGTKCDCYNNFISQGKGSGIECHGLGGTRIFNNIIVNPGSTFAPADKAQMKYGIFVSDDDSIYYIEHNDIINPKSDGIRFLGAVGQNCLIASNVIINPGNFDYYENGNTSFKGKDSYIMFQNSVSKATIRNNYLTRNAGSAGFATLNMQIPADFKLTPESPLINVAEIDKTINFDFIGNPRPIGFTSDIGAFEYDGITESKRQPVVPSGQIRLLQNPVKEYLIFGLPVTSEADIFLNIFDLNGKMIFQVKQSEIVSENQTIQANISKIAPGIYIYTIRSGEHARSGKFIKR